MLHTVNPPYYKLQKTVDAVKCMDASERGEPGLLNPSGLDLEKTAAGWTPQVIWDRGIGNLKVFRADPTKYGVFTFTGVAGVAFAPAVRGMRTTDRCNSVCNVSCLAVWVGCTLKGMKLRILSFCIPWGHTLYLGFTEFTATAAIECFLSCLVSSSLCGHRIATQYLDNLGCLEELCSH